MQLDTTLSLDVVIAIIAIFGAVWWLNRDIDSKITSLRDELKADNANLRDELKADIANLRDELKTDNANLRDELKTDNANLRDELKADTANLYKEIKTLDRTVDASNQRLARLEGAILSREGLIDVITETDSTA